MKTWKWSLGETYYKSARQIKSTSKLDNEINENYDTQQTAIEQSLNNSLFDSKREDIDSKLADREMMSQRGYNPFFTQTSYVNDVVTRDIFLKPLNTTHERIKNPE